MFAVLKTGGKQYKVQSGDVLRVEKLAADAGETIQFNDVLMLGGDAAAVGAPFVDGAAVQAEVIDQIKGEKTIKFVKRRRKHSSKRTRGHRQQLTLVRITDILSSGADKSGVKAAVGAASVPAAAAAAAPAAKPAAKKAAPKAEAPAADAGADDLTAIIGVGPAQTFFQKARRFLALAVIGIAFHQVPARYAVVRTDQDVWLGVHDAV